MTYLLLVLVLSECPLRDTSHTQLDIAIVDRDIPGKHASYKAGGHVRCTK